jgi:hypothetical protein
LSELATLLAVAGVSLWCSIFVIRSLKTRIEKLERVVASSETAARAEATD